MKETLQVFFVAPNERVARRVVRAAGLESQTEIDVTSGRVAVARDDPRAELLLDELRDVDAEPFLRVDRTWTKRELDSCEWLHLRVVTAGLSGTVNYGQPYDHWSACRVCGAGAEPVPPLLADLPRMGKKHLDATAHDGQLVVSRALADACESAGLTGFTLEAVRAKSPRYPTDGHRWLRITSEWPPWSTSTRVERDDPCPRCRRTGNYDTLLEPVALHYDRAPQDASDFNRAYERLGFWRLPNDPPVGGAQAVLVSQRVRRVFAALPVRRIAYEPVSVAESAA